MIDFTEDSNSKTTDDGFKSRLVVDGSKQNRADHDIYKQAIELGHKNGPSVFRLVETEVQVLEMHIHIRIYDPIPIAVAAVKQGLGIIHLVI